MATHTEDLIELTTPEVVPDVTAYKLVRMTFEMKRKGIPPKAKFWFERVSPGPSGDYPEGANIGHTVSVGEPQISTMWNAKIETGDVGKGFLAQVGAKACAFLAAQGAIVGTAIEVVIDD